MMLTNPPFPLTLSHFQVQERERETMGAGGWRNNLCSVSTNRLNVLGCY